MIKTIRNGQSVYLLEYRDGDILPVSVYALGKLLHEVNDGDHHVRIFAR